VNLWKQKKRKTKQKKWRKVC